MAGKRPKRHPGQPRVRRMRAPWLTYCVLCESAETDSTGAVSINRIANRWTVPASAFPAGFPVTVALGIVGLPAADRKPLDIQFYRERDNHGIMQRSDMIAHAGPDLNIIIPVDLFVAEEPGAYRLSVVYGDWEIGLFPFTVVADASVPHEGWEWSATPGRDDPSEDTPDEGDSNQQ